MAVDAVMSMMGTGLGDAVVEVVYRVVLAHAGHIGADWHVGSFAYRRSHGRGRIALKSSV